MASPRPALAELTSPAVAGDLLVVPLGATEQHGPHLPLGTDTIIASALASRRSTRSSPRRCPYGSSGEHAGFAGTLSIGRAALEHVLVELGALGARSRACCSCARTAATPSRSRARACGQLRGEGTRRAAPGRRRLRGGDAHAGRIETSLMLALAPDARRRRARAAATSRRSPS